MKDKDSQLLWEAYSSDDLHREDNDVKLTPFEAERLKNAAAAKKLTGGGPLKDVEDDDEDEKTVKEGSEMDSFEVMNMMVEKGIEYVKKYGNKPDGMEIEGPIKEIEMHFLKFINANRQNFADPDQLISYIEDEGFAQDIENTIKEDDGDGPWADDALDFEFYFDHD